MVDKIIYKIDKYVYIYIIFNNKWNKKNNNKNVKNIKLKEHKLTLKLSIYAFNNLKITLILAKILIKIKTTRRSIKKKINNHKVVSI